VITEYSLVALDDFRSVFRGEPFDLRRRVVIDEILSARIAAGRVYAFTVERDNNPDDISKNVEQPRRGFRSKHRNEFLYENTPFFDEQRRFTD